LPGDNYAKRVTGHSPKIAKNNLQRKCLIEPFQAVRDLVMSP
jgi:hypothetical protein